MHMKNAEAIQSFEDRNDMKMFHVELKTVYGPKSSGWSHPMIHFSQIKCYPGNVDRTL